MRIPFQSGFDSSLFWVWKTARLPYRPVLSGKHERRVMLCVPLPLQTFDSLSCNSNEELEQLQLEMMDLRQEVRRLKVKPILGAGFFWLVPSAVVLREGNGVACPS